MKGSMLGTAAGLAMLTTACATMEAAGPATQGAGQCNADGTDGFIGQKATAEAGQELLQTTGARELRWVPPNTAVTMDFRPDRLTVSYDDDMVIERVTCG